MPKPSGKNPDPEDKKRRLEKLLGAMQGQVVRGSAIKGPGRKAKRSAAPKKTCLSLGNMNLSGKSEPLDLKTARREGSGETASLRDFYPDGEVLGGGQEGAWRLRLETSLDGAANIATGVRMPGQRDNFEFLDLGLAKILNPGVDLEGLGREDLAFLDTETTGLMGGTGTYAFLVGLGFFSGDAFVVEQYFMEDFPDEEVMLEALGERLGDFEALVTFNGKAFDAPLLRSRFVMNRLPSALEKPHLDLLHPARRIWKGRLESCSLGTIEERVFELGRTSDVPGFLIPQIYLDFIQGIRRERIVPVIDHNVQDIVSMAALFALFCRYYREPDSRDLQHKVSQVGLAEWFLRAGRSGEGLERLEKALLLCRDAEEEHALSMRIATFYRRLGRWDDALDVWRERSRVGASGALRAGARVEMAKYFEHRAKDFVEAQKWARKALADLQGKPFEEEGEETQALAASDEVSIKDDDFLDPDEALAHEDLQIAALLHRLKRLRRKMERAKAKPRAKDSGQ